MNILITLCVALFALCLLWAVQSIVLKLIGEPLAWPLRFETRKPVMRYTSRVMIQLTWLIILIGTQFALGIPLLDAFRQAFRTPIPWRDIAIAFSLMFFLSCVLYAIYIAVGWVRIEPQHDQATRRAKLIRRFWGPLVLATLEEAVFRGLLLEQLLRSFPSSQAYAALAIVVSSAMFTSVHFFRPHGNKPVWQMAYGYFTVGCVLGLAYVVGGRALWIPIVVHATAVFGVEVMRLYTVYVGPRWLIGLPELPQSGLLGSLFLLAVAMGLVTLI
jgi:membrane protease YdiL (CAAX protease family)